MRPRYGVLVADCSAAVYTLSPPPVIEAGTDATRAAPRSQHPARPPIRSASSCAAAVSALVRPKLVRIYEPIDIGEVVRRMRSML